MALTNKLTAIANAIREKTGTTNTLTLDEMPTAISNISSGGGDLPAEAFNITGDCEYRFANSGWDWFINNYSDRITTSSITDAGNMFYNNNLTSIPFDINLRTSSYNSASNLFSGCSKIESLPYVTGKIGDCFRMFFDCSRLNHIPEDWATKLDWSAYSSNNYISINRTFEECRSLRRIPQNLINSIVMTNPISTSYSYYPYNYQYDFCFSLEELRDIPVSYYSSGNTSNLFNYFVESCTRLKTLTFKKNDDGTPMIAKWKSQTIDMSSHIGYAATAWNITDYNSGLTTATQITDDASYQSLKNNPDSWTTLIQYSRYNHDSAVETINSLPDTSAYLSTAGGTNTIKFKGASGSATDGGAINTLTEEEIAVATAKGWTISIV